MHLFHDALVSFAERWDIKMKELKNFLREEDGMGTVEVVLIIVVLIALVTIFRDGIKSVVQGVLKTIKADANAM